MSDPQEQKPTRVEVYQLYIWVKEISPLIGSYTLGDSLYNKLPALS